MKVVHVAAEGAPFCRTGGLGDVIASLPAALAEAGVDVVTVLPLHRSARRRLDELGATLVDRGPIDVPSPHPARALELPGPVPTVFVDAPGWFDRPALYDEPDDALRFGFFSRAAPLAGARVLGPPDVLHAHDWMTALSPVHLDLHLRDRLPDTRSVFTIHNLAFQGVFDKTLLEPLGLDWSLFRFDHLEQWDRLNLMKGAIAAADAVTTVSPTYAGEILTPAFGHGLDAHLRAHAHKLRGIVNGLDTNAWNPETDPELPMRFRADDVRGKAACRAALLGSMGLPDRGGAVVGVISRLTDQKGLDLVCEVAPRLAERGASLVVLGTGDPSLERRFQALATERPDAIAAYIGFDDGLARRILGAADVLLVPSRFEPCGLTQLQAMRYGALPVVHAVGGLADTVTDPGDDGLRAGRGDGFRFEHPTAEGLWWALDRALRMYGDTAAWAALRERAMRRDLGWASSVPDYLTLYEDLARGGPAG